MGRRIEERTTHKQYHVETIECHTKELQLCSVIQGSTNLGLNILIGINGLAGTPNLYLFVYYVYLLWSSCMLRFSQPMDRLGHLTLESDPEARL